MARLLVTGWALGALCVLSANAFGQVAATKKDDRGFLGGKWYGTAELRHHSNTYYDTEGALKRQEPSVHARLQLGAQFYEGLIDAYVTMGVFKVPETQQLMQRRPELAFDYYPLHGENVSVLQYNMVQLPVKTSATIPINEDEKYEMSLDPGAIYTIGLAPSAKFPFQALSSRFEVKGGLDGWTRMFSRRQFTSEYFVPQDDEVDDGGPFALAPTDSDPIEDYALHYRAQAMSGFSWSPLAFKEFSTEATLHMQSQFDPRYTRDDEGDVDYKYGVYRYSYYRARLRYEISERLAVTNDFYHFFEGAFQAKREGEDRRFRNILRLSCKL